MRRRKLIKPGDAVALTFSKRDHALLREELIYTSGELDDKLAVGLARGNGIRFQLTLDHLDELIGCVAAAANHARNGKLGRALDRIYEKLMRLLDSYEEVEDAAEVPEPPPGVH